MIFGSFEKALPTLISSVYLQPPDLLMVMVYFRVRSTFLMEKIFKGKMLTQ
jgi:hypothetical protein